jgi:hypothetical protein
VASGLSDKRPMPTARLGAPPYHTLASASGRLQSRSPSRLPKSNGRGAPIATYVPHPAPFVKNILAGSFASANCYPLRVGSTFLKRFFAFEPNCAR